MIIIIIILSLCYWFHLLVFLCMSCHHFAQSHFQVFVSLYYCFVLVPGWWIHYTYRFVLPLCGRQNFLTLYQKCQIFMGCKNGRIGFPKWNFAGHWDGAVWNRWDQDGARETAQLRLLVSEECVSSHFQGGKEKMFCCKMMGKRLWWRHDHDYDDDDVNDGDVRLGESVVLLSRLFTPRLFCPSPFRWWGYQHSCQH